MSGTLRWIIQHGFDLVPNVGVIASLLFTAASYRTDTRSRRLSNLIVLTEQHRDIWKEFIDTPELKRVLDSEAKLKSRPITEQEKQFVVLILLHLHCWYRAVQIDEVRESEGLSRDIKSFFSLPIPRAVWEERREFYDSDFARFVDENSDII